MARYPTSWRYAESWLRNCHRLGRRQCSPAHRLRRKRGDHHVAHGVPQDDEPVARGNVAPPLILRARGTGAIEHVAAPPRVGVGIRIGAMTNLAAVGEFRDGAWTVQRTHHDFHQWPTDAAPFSPVS